MPNQNTQNLFTLLSKYASDSKEKDKISKQINDLLKQNIVEQNIDINYRDKYSKNVLHLAASNGYAGTIDALIDAGAEVDSPDKYGQTPICSAIIAGQTEIVKKLIEKDARLDTKDIYGNNAFHIASEYNMGGAIKLLFWAEADSQLINKNGKKPLVLAAEKYSTDAIIAFNEEFIKGEDISHIEDYKVALDTIKKCPPDSSSLEWNNYIISLEILEDVVAQYEYQEQEKNQFTSMSLEVSFERSNEDENLQAESNFSIANDENEAGLSPSNPQAMHLHHHQVQL